VIHAIAFCPHPPVLHPEVAQGAADELENLRAACDDAVGFLLDARLAEVVVLGAGSGAREHSGEAVGTFAGFGVDVRVGGSGEPTLPLSLTVGAWLLNRAGWGGARRYVEIPEGPGESAAPLHLPGRCALLVMGDGSARRSVQAPGYLDERAAWFDAAVARALADGDPAALASTVSDPVGAELMAAGLAPWRVAAATAAREWDGAPIDARLLADEAPYGVGYLVALWTTNGAARSSSSTTTDAADSGAHSRR